MTNRNQETILLSGGAGFIGANLVHRLRRKGRYKVVNLDKLTYAGNLRSLASLQDDPGHVFIHGDIGDRELVRSLLQRYSPVAILNLAAETHVDRSITDPDSFVSTNVVGTYHLLEEARAYYGQLPEEAQAAFRFVHISTDEVYGSLGETGAFSEESAYAPNSPYAASKASSDHFVRAYHVTYGLPTIITNCSNNFGPYQFPEKLIPLMILQAKAGKPLPVYGQGLNVRDWIYVEDHCAALEIVMQKGLPGEVYNIGADNEMQNIHLVKTLCEIMDELRPAHQNQALLDGGIETHESLIRFVADRPGHDERYAIDASKIRKQLGWKPTESFTSALAKTVHWYLDNPEWVESVQTGSYKDWLDRNYASRLEEDRST